MLLGVDLPDQRGALDCAIARWLRWQLLVLGALVDEMLAMGAFVIFSSQCVQFLSVRPPQNLRRHRCRNKLLSHVFVPSMSTTTSAYCPHPPNLAYPHLDLPMILHSSWWSRIAPFRGGAMPPKPKRASRAKAKPKASVARRDRPVKKQKTDSDADKGSDEQDRNV